MFITIFFVTIVDCYKNINVLYYIIIYSSQYYKDDNYQKYFLIRLELFSIDNLSH